MRTSLFASAALVFAAAGVVVISAQHHGGSQATHAVSSHQMMMSHCGGNEEATRAHHAQLASALGLTAEQTATVERVSTEACAAMARFHEQILAVLTPEQRTKLQELHGAHEGGDHPAAVVKRHGGR